MTFVCWFGTQVIPIDEVQFLALAADISSLAHGWERKRIRQAREKRLSRRVFDVLTVGLLPNKKYIRKLVRPLFLRENLRNVQKI